MVWYISEGFDPNTAIQEALERVNEIQDGIGKIGAAIGETNPEMGFLSGHRGIYGEQQGSAN
jgi:hypothetical protein